MRKVLVFVLSFFLLLGLLSGKVSAQNETSEAISQSQFFQAKVVEIIEEGKREAFGGISQPFQKLKVKILSGSEKGKEIEIDHGSLFSLTEDQKVSRGEYVVVTKARSGLYYISDRFRLYPVLAVFAVLVLALLLISRKRFFGFMAAMGVIIYGLGRYVVPEIMVGRDPVLVSAVAGFVAIFLITFLGYGGEKGRLGSFLIAATAFGLSLGLTHLLLFLAGISGTGSEEAIFLQAGAVDPSGLRGLLLAGVTAGSVGAITYVANRKAEAADVLPLVSILVLAYLGASLSLLMLFSINASVPFWVGLNSEFISEEVIRILVGLAAVLFTARVRAIVPGSRE